MQFGATYHIHVSLTASPGRRTGRVNVNRTRWLAGKPSVSGSVAQLRLSELTIDPGTPLDQAIACCEAALAALLAERHQAELDAQA